MDDFKAAIGFSVNYSDKLAIIVMNDSYIKVIKIRLLFYFSSEVDILIKFNDER